MTFGSKILMAREAHHLTQQELAERCGLTARTIHNYESGSRMPQTRRIYAKLAEALGISEKELMDNRSEVTLLNTDPAEEFERGYWAGRKSLQPKWINAEEHPPKQDGIYFAVIQTAGMQDNE